MAKKHIIERALGAALFNAYLQTLPVEIVMAASGETVQSIGESLGRAHTMSERELRTQILSMLKSLSYWQVGMALEREKAADEVWPEHRLNLEIWRVLSQDARVGPALRAAYEKVAPSFLIISNDLPGTAQHMLDAHDCAITMSSIYNFYSSLPSNEELTKLVKNISVPSKDKFPLSSFLVLVSIIVFVLTIVAGGLFLLFRFFR